MLEGAVHNRHIFSKNWGNICLHVWRYYSVHQQHATQKQQNSTPRTKPTLTVSPFVVNTTNEQRSTITTWQQKRGSSILKMRHKTTPREHHDAIVSNYNTNVSCYYVHLLVTNHGWYGIMTSQSTRLSGRYGKHGPSGRSPRLPPPSTAAPPSPLEPVLLRVTIDSPLPLLKPPRNVFILPGGDMESATFARDNNVAAIMSLHCPSCRKNIYKKNIFVLLFQLHYTATSSSFQQWPPIGEAWQHSTASSCSDSRQSDHGWYADDARTIFFNTL